MGWAARSTADLAAAGAVAARCIITGRHRTEDATTTGPSARARERCGANSSLQPQPVCHGVDQIAGPTAGLATAGAVTVALSTSYPGPPQHRGSRSGQSITVRLGRLQTNVTVRLSINMAVCCVSALRLCYKVCNMYYHKQIVYQKSD